MVGAVLSHYRILEKIGSGGMGVVYRAEDVDLRREVALKFLLGDSACRPQARARFLREARTAAALNHPNICTIHEVSEIGENHALAEDGARIPAGAPFLSMELIPGASLRELLDESGPLPFARLVDTAIQIAEGLTAAHARGIVHRDLKPGNVMVTPELRVKILDFGLAKAIAPEPAALTTDVATRTSESLTRVGVIMGTYPYMSPEQVEGKALDARSDIFSFGTILYEMATGTNPFTADTAAATSANILKGEPAPIAQARTDLPERLEKVTRRCLRKDPEERYRDTGELVTELKALQRNVETRSTSPVRGFPASRRHVVPFFATVFAVILLVLARFLWPGAPALVDSIAVLPVANLSGDTQQYLTAGITDGLIGELSQIGALRVISRHTVTQYESSDKPLPVIAQELGVRSLLEGTLVRRENQLRLAVRLVQGSPEKILWAQSYERSIEDVMTLYGEVAKAIAQEIQLAVTAEEATRLASARPVDPEVYDAYLRARYLLQKMTVQSGREAIEYFNRALAKDPEFAPAYAGLTDAYILAAQVDPEVSPQGGYAKAKDAASRALETDPSRAEAHSAMGAVCMVEWRSAESEVHFRRALQIDPNSVTALVPYSIALGVNGRHEDAIEHAIRARERDPLNPYVNANVVFRLYMATLHERAIEDSRTVLDSDPDNWIALWGAGHAFLALESYGEAILVLKEADEILRSDGSESLEVRSTLAYAYARSGREAEARALVEQLETGLRNGTSRPWLLAVAHTGLRDHDLVFHWLERAFDEREGFLNMTPRLPLFREIFSDPRLADLEARIRALAGSRETWSKGG